jgi:hypothetical protein
MKTGLRASLYLILALFIILSGYLVISTLILPAPQSKEAYACRIDPEEDSFTSFEGQRIPVRFQIKNLGSESWSSKGESPCLLSYHLLDHTGKTICRDNRRFPLPRKVKPGQSLKMTANIIAPLQEGRYILEFDLVREGISWFKDYGSPTARISLAVKGKKRPEDDLSLSLDYGPYTKFESSIPELEKTLRLIRLTLEENEVGFSGKTGRVHGFSAGEDYPQIWLRDAATIIPASRCFYGADFLSSWLEEHLAFQRENGSLVDWIDSRGRFDKNTTETDQETSAVQAAFRVCELLGSSWLGKQIKGEKIISRLERSLAFLLDNRMERKFGLLKGAHTADWGDVDIVDGDQKAIYTDRHTHWTVDIYDQSMFYEACLRLAQMLDSLGRSEKADFWRQKADSIQKNTDKWLWQEERGFYRVHLHLDDFRHGFDEDDIFATGGNTQAILSGLAGEGKSPRIINQALKRQRLYGLSTISGTLLPPYPQHTFKHPQLDDPYEYQNGGQWDWFGGKLVYSMFEQGFSLKAREKLVEILRKNLANRTFFEWDSRQGIGQGNGYFCGSAGSLSKAIFEGYFGIKMGRDSLTLEPKIGKESARIHVYLPSCDRFAAYQYSFHPEEDKLTLRYNSNVSGTGTIKILNPWKNQESGQEISRKDWRVEIDGRSVDFKIEKKNADEFLVIKSDFEHHTLEIIYFRPME